MAQDSDPELAWATLRQERLPQWAARAETATRQARAREAFFEGENSFTDAFPSLASASLDSPAVVAGRLGALQQRATAREAERQTALPPLGDPAHTAEARESRKAALKAEEWADSLIHRFLTGVAAHLVQHPELSSEGVAHLREPLELEQERLAQPLSDPADEAKRVLRLAELDAELAALRQLQMGVRLHVVAERPLEAPPVEPIIRVGQVGRWRLWLPWLEAEDAAGVREALEEWSAGPALEKAKETRSAAADALVSARSEALPESVEVYEAQLEAADQAIVAAAAAVAAVPEPGPRRERRILLQEAAQDQRAAAKLRLDRAKGDNDGLLDAATAAAEQARAEAEAAAAAASADDETARLRAELLGQAADARDRVADAAGALDEKRTQLKDEKEKWEADLVALRARLSEVEKASPIPGTGPDADEVYREVRSQRKALIDGDIALGITLQGATEKVGEVVARGQVERQAIARGRERLDDPASRTALSNWEKALEDEVHIFQDVQGLARDERQAVLTMLQGLSEVRRELRGYASSEERLRDQRELGADIVRELRLLGPTILARLATRGEQLLGLPWRLVRDATLLIDIVWGFFWTIVLLGGWYWARGKAYDIAGRVTVWVKRLKPDLRPIDAHRMRSPAEDAIRATIDLCLGYLMVGRISPLSPEIAFLVEAWLLVAIYRALLATFDLLVVRAPEFRPSLVALAPNVYDLLRFTARVAIIWGIARGFTYYVLWSTLQLDTVATLAMTLFNLVALGLAVYLLYLWDPILRERVRARNQESRLVAFLSRDVPRPLSPLSALAMLAFFTMTAGSDLLYFFVARDRTGLARVLNVISRYQMGAEEDLSVVPIPKESIDALCTTEMNHPVHVARPELDEELDGAYAGWKKERRRGMVALIGDRGMGKRTEIARFLKRVARGEGALEPVRGRFDDVVTEEQAVLDWLADLAEVEHVESSEELVDALRARPRTLFVLEQAHRCYLRSVGGFAAISQLLYVLNATSDQHFWLVTFHSPAWRYLSAIPSIVDVGVFRSTVLLAPFDAGMLRELTSQRAKRVGLTLDYRGLMRANLLGADPDVELERATNAYYRLLAEASDGNPRVAMHQFAACLEPGERAGMARVLTRRALRTEVASDLSVDALFTLTALRQEDSMELDSMVEVTNLPAHAVRNTVRDLQSRGLVSVTHDRVYIPITHLPLVSRTLRRRHLLHLGS